MLSEFKSKLAQAFGIVPLLRTATVNGTGVDLANCGTATVSFFAGAITDGTFTPSVEESDASGSGYTAVAAGDLTNTLSALSASSIQTVGYIGRKRYIRPVITASGSPATGGNVGAIVTKTGLRKQT